MRQKKLTKLRFIGKVTLLALMQVSRIRNCVTERADSQMACVRVVYAKGTGLRSTCL